VTELADLIDDTSSCITHRVNRLVAAGLVVKHNDPHDGRVRIVALTGRGRALLEAAAPDHAARVRQWVIDPLTRRDLTDLTRITDTVRSHLRSLPAGTPVDVHATARPPAGHDRGGATSC
jgi:DNA-binding MarR family transcriptional regulator